MGASPSATLRALWVVGASGAEAFALRDVAFFFESSTADGFVQGVGQHAQLRTDRGYAGAFIEHGLRTGDAFLGELVPVAGHRGAKEAPRALLAQLFAASFHRDQWHPEGAGDLSLRSGAIRNELTGKEAERSEVIRRMAKDRQMAVEVIDAPIALLKGKFVRNGGATRREDRKLNLRHCHRVDSLPAECQAGSLTFPLRRPSPGRGQDV
ncbi:MAG: hypothetical protein O3C40_34130 [Planctomycetota bacterium]|nr:hypothetical protein [Planctomycetota bacterium]